MKTLFILFTIAAVCAAEAQGQTSTPASSEVPTKVAATKPEVYYILTHMSVTTDSGIEGVAPGTKVILVRQSDQGLVVSDGQNQFNVSRGDLTSDADAALHLRAADRNSQAAISAARAQQLVLVAQSEKVQRERQSVQSSDVEQTSKAKAGDRDGRIAELRDEIAKCREKMDELRGDFEAKRSYSTHMSRRDRDRQTALNNQLQAGLDQQGHKIERAQSELSALGVTGARLE